MPVPPVPVPRRFEGRSVVVTGAGTGFGAEIAVRAAQEGARAVGVHYRSSVEGAKRTADRVAAEGSTPVLLQADIIDWEQIKALAEAAFERRACRGGCRTARAGSSATGSARTTAGTAATSPSESLNHYSKGAVIMFLHRYVAGIRLLDGGPGYRHFRIEPRPGGGITWAQARHDSPYGRIESAWRLDGGTFELSLTVPPGTTAEVALPDGSRRMVAPGRRTLRCAVA